MISVYIGNLPYDTTEDQVVELFKHYGEVHRAALVKDRETGRPRGFGFVEMPNADEARAAIQALSGKDFEGRPLTVNEARNRSSQRNSANLSRSAHKPHGEASDTPAPPHAGEYTQADHDQPHEPAEQAEQTPSDAPPEHDEPADDSQGYRNNIKDS